MSSSEPSGFVRRGFLVVISGPSGVGKTSFCAHLLETRNDTVRSISATTRTIRPGEQNGRDYFFEGTTHTPIEPHCAIGLWEEGGAGVGRLTVWSSTQVPHYLHRELAKVLELDPARVRVVQPVGGLARYVPREAGVGLDGQRVAGPPPPPRLAVGPQRPDHLVTRQEMLLRHPVA